MLTNEQKNYISIEKACPGSLKQSIPCEERMRNYSTGTVKIL